VLEELETEARDAKKGQWVDPQPSVVGIAMAQRLRREDRLSQGLVGKKNPRPIWYMGGVKWSRAHFTNLWHACMLLLTFLLRRGT